MWFDEFSIKPGDSLTATIERGLTTSLHIVLVLSSNYFEGWSEHERRAAFNLFTKNKSKIVPVWYLIDSDFVDAHAPLLADIKAVVVKDSTVDPQREVIAALAQVLRPEEQRNKLVELLLRALNRSVPDDPNVKLFLAVIDNDLEALQRACESGANVNVTDNAIIQYYHKLIVHLGYSEAMAKLLVIPHRGQLPDRAQD